MNAKLFRPGNTLDNPLVGVTDYGKKLITVGDPESGGVSEWVNRNVVDYFMDSRPDIFGHTSTFVKPYKVVNGELVEANPDDITPQDITNNAVYFYIGGATAGPNRERMAQLFQPNGEKLIPIGDPSFYQGESRDGWKDAIATLAPIALMAFPGLGQTIGTYLGATTAATATALGNVVINTATQVAAGVPLDRAIVNNAVTYGVSQYIPNLTNNPYIDNAIRSVAVAKLTGGDEQMALANSLIATGATDFLGNANITGDKTIDSGLVSGLTSSLQAAATGGDAGASFVQGFARGASTKISQDEALAQRAASGAGFLGEYEDLSGAGPADYVMGERDPALVQAGFFDSARGLAQSALADLGRSWLAAGQQVGIAPQTLQRAIDYLSVIEQGGEALIPDDVKAQQQAFINKIYGVASNPNSSATDIGRAVVEATIENPLGSLTLVSKEVIQELPQLLIPGRLPAMLGNFVLNIAESAGNQALQKIDELRQANPNMTNEQLIAAARNDAGVAGAVTAAMSLLPGMNTRVLQPAIQSANEFLESGLTTYLLTGDRSKALGDAILGGVIGGKTTTALQTGEQVAEAAQQTLPSLGTITVSSTRLPPDQPVVDDTGETLAITPSVVTKQGSTSDVPVGQLPSAVVISTDPTSNTALVIDSTGATKIVSATDAATGQPVTQGQTLTITSDNTLTSGGGQVVSTDATPTGSTPTDATPTGGTPTGGTTPVTTAATGFDPNQKATPEIVAELLSLKGFPVSDKTIGFLLTGGPTVKQVGQEIQNIAGMVTQRNLQQPVYDAQTGLPTIQTGAQGQPTIISQYTPDVTPATAGSTQFTALTQGDETRPTTDTTVRPGQSEADLQRQAYSANVAATPEIVAELLALKGLPESEGTIRILMAGNPTIAQVGQEIEILAQMRRDQQPTVAPTQQPTGTPTVVTGQQTGPTIITDAAQQTKPAIDSKVTQDVATQTATSTAQQSPAEVLINARFTQAGKVASQQDIQNLLNQAQQMGVNLASANVGFTPQYQAWAQLVYDTANDIKRATPTFVATEPAVKPTVTESLDLTFNPGRVNIDTLEDTGTALDTATGFDTVRAEDTTPTFDTVVDTLPQDTVPTYGEDEDIIRFLGLDQEPTPTEPEAPPAEDTIGGGTGTTNVIPEERLAVAPKAVYTPKPGTRVVDTGTSTGILPTRVQLSEGMGDDVEGTGEEEQQPVWNVRSLKLRRALGI